MCSYILYTYIYVQTIIHFWVKIYENKKPGFNTALGYATVGGTPCRRCPLSRCLRSRSPSPHFTLVSRSEIYVKSPIRSLSAISAWHVVKHIHYWSSHISLEYLHIFSWLCLVYAYSIRVNIMNLFDRIQKFLAMVFLEKSIFNRLRD